jgi:hypothetical protein
MNVKRNLPFLNRSLAYSPLPLSGVVRISTEKGNSPYNGFGGASTKGGVVRDILVSLSLAISDVTCSVSGRVRMSAQ